MQIDSSSLLQMGNVQRVQNSQSKLNGLERRTVQNSAHNSQKSLEDTRLKEACKDFQSIFVKQMLDSMKKTINKGGLLDGGQAEEIFGDMLYDEYAKKISENGNLGLDKMMYQQLKSY